MNIVIREIAYAQAQLFSQSLARFNNVVFFHSARYHADLARYSFIGIDPYKIFKYELGKRQSIFEAIDSELRQYRTLHVPDLPPFQGGLAGYLSYDLVRDLEILPNNAATDIPYPKLILGCYDLVIAYDHFVQRAWIFSSGFPETNSTLRRHRAEKRLDWLRAQVIGVSDALVDATATDCHSKIVSNFSRADYIEAVKRIKNYILSGDVFQVNLSQRFQCDLPQDASPFQLYQNIIKENPAPFSSYMRFDDLAIASSSPERFLQVQQRRVETRPIKGTMRRSSDVIEDQQLAKQLLASEKDRAENAMIVDLMRNDLSRVCRPHSVKVTQLCGLETFENVHHLVSAVRGQLRDDYALVDLLKATLAGGSITGAPKVRAMEIIDELEPTCRGPYCGNAIYLGFNGMMDSSILIRTAVIWKQLVTFQAGGAVVLDSDPDAEYAESLVKASALFQVLGSIMYNEQVE